jgi:hypothetical protein
MNIWVEAVKEKAGVEEIEVEDDIKEAMEAKLVEMFEEREVDYEDFLNVMVPLILPMVGREMEMDLANELMGTYFPNTVEYKDEALGIMTSRDQLTSIQKIKIKASFRQFSDDQAEHNLHLLRNVDNGGGETGAVFTLREFLRKMTHVPKISGLGG